MQSIIKKAVIRKQDAIVNELLEFTSNNYGLFLGKSGIILSLNNYQYSNSSNEVLSDKINAITNNFFNDVFDNIVNEINQSSWGFAYGVSGILYVISYIDKKNNKEKYLDDEQRNILNNLILQNLKSLQGDNLEIFNGKLGLVNYLLYSEFDFEESFIAVLCDELLQVTKSNKNINFGLAHGIPSFVIIVAKLYEKSKSIKAQATLILLLEFIESFYKEENMFSKYPCEIVEGVPKYQNRMAWCYGDIGVCFALLKAGEILKKNELIDKSLKIMKTKIHNNNYGEVCITETSFCHGLLGVAYLFSKFAYLTKDPHLKSAGDKWFKDGLTFDFYTYPYKTNNQHILNDINNRNIKHMTSDSKLSLLEGKSGELIILSSFLNNYFDDWDNCFLIS